jgi:enoyl-CoA hydratase/carnithine racemase
MVASEDNPSGQPLLVSFSGPVATLRLNRPERRNALSLSLMRRLLEALREIGRRRDVRAVILDAAGPVFCAGHDLEEMTGGTVTHYREIFDTCTELMAAMQAIPQAVIGQVQGMATAAGCQLAATCDLVVASAEARFATPGVRIGLFCTTPMVALTRAIGRKRAMEMLLTGRAVDAATAADWGLVNRVVPHDELASAAQTLAMEVATASQLTLSIGKQAFYAQVDMEQPKAYAYAKEVMSLNAMAADAQEGMSAFLEKRKPCWQDR